MLSGRGVAPGDVRRVCELKLSRSGQGGERLEKWKTESGKRKAESGPIEFKAFLCLVAHVALRIKRYLVYSSSIQVSSSSSSIYFSSGRIFPGRFRGNYHGAACSSGGRR